MEPLKRWTNELTAEVRAVAEGAGFHLAGITPADASADSSNDASNVDRERFVAWVEAGRAGEMEYLKRRDASGELLRSGVRVALPWARSVLVCALDYSSGEAMSVADAPKRAGWIARYAWSGRQNDPTGTRVPGEVGSSPMMPTDYHDEMLGRLRIVESWIRDRAACQTRSYVDTGPIVERGFAARAGVGWIGKNTCVINQGMGSWLLLGVIVTSMEVCSEFELTTAADRCGSCTRCIDACPTDALVAPREMDASRCIAYLTIEKKGPIADDLREGMGRQVFGCDICQDVCPWNTKARNKHAPADVTSGMEVRRELVNPDLEWLAAMDAKEFKQWFKGSPLERTGRKRLHRNVALAMGNSGESEFLPRLRTWSEGEDQVLAEAARWAVERILSASIGRLS